LGATLKNIETIEEQSSFGTHSMDGVIIFKINKNSKLSKSLIKEGDVIIGIKQEKVKNISNFIDTYKKYDYSENTTFIIVRNQKEMEIEFKN
jgi:S1-C subfamily serine protease